MNAKKTGIVILLFILAITALRLTFVYMQRSPAHPEAKDGILDLRGWTLPADRAIDLNGQWRFYPDKLLYSGPADADHPAPPSTEGSQGIQVPGRWSSAYGGGGSLRPAFHYGTYLLTVKLGPRTDDESYRLRIQEIRSSSSVYVNGRFVAGAGRPSSSKADYSPRYVPYTVPLAVRDGTIEIAIQVADHTGEGGLNKPILLGTAEAIDRRIDFSVGLQLLLCVVLAVHAVYACLLYAVGLARRGLFYFALIIVFAIVSVLTADERLLLQWLPVPYELSVKITLWSYIGVLSLMPRLIMHIFSDFSGSRFVRWYEGFQLSYALIVLATPSSYLLPASHAFFLTFGFLFTIVALGRILRTVIRKQDMIFLLLGCLSLSANLLWTIVLSRLRLNVLHYPFDLMITVFCFAAFWFKRYFRAAERTNRLARELESANERKDEFLIHTSHELRNPLHGMMNIAQSVLDDPKEPVGSEHRERLEIQMAIARRLSFLLEDLLDVARLKENRIRLQLADVRLSSVATGVAAMLRYQLAGKPIELKIDVPDSFPAVRADEQRLVQILYNLLHNAIKFTDEGTISIRASVEGDVARVSVEDTGRGIDPELGDRIFAPYEQGSEEGGSGGGFGLGLSVCKQLTELQGGTLTFASSPGEGSVFAFTLGLGSGSELGDEAAAPAEPSLLGYRTEAAPTREESEGQEAAPEADDGNPGPRVLIVDDDPLNRKIMVDILGTSRYRFGTASDAAEALNELRLGAYDLVISDVMMPRMSGYELTRSIREKFSMTELPVLLLTARSRPQDIFAGFQAGANDYAAKPVEALELRSRVRALTELKLSVEKRLSMEAAWLQAQIRPHFVFNTLNAIASLGTTDFARMQELLEEFSLYLRRSFDLQNSDRLVPLEHELELVRSYLFIERARFGDRLAIVWEVDPGLSAFIPPLSVQTLVENAVNHGILRRARGGNLSILVRKQARGIEVAVSDDGVGMSEEKLRSFAAGGARSGQGIGLANTDRRLRQLFGERLSIRSVPGEGTTVAFRIPEQIPQK